MERKPQFKQGKTPTSAEERVKIPAPRAILFALLWKQPFLGQNAPDLLSKAAAKLGLTPSGQNAGKTHNLYILYIFLYY